MILTRWMTVLCVSVPRSISQAYLLLLTLWLVAHSVAQDTAQAEDTSEWSSWFDVESSKGIDNQSLALIREIFQYECPFSNIVRTQCRKVDAGTFPERYPQDATFSNTFWYEDEYLRVPCDRSGLVCVDTDQAWAHMHAKKRKPVEAGGSTTDSVDDFWAWPISTREASTNSTFSEGTTSFDLNSSGGIMSDEQGDAEASPYLCSDYEIRFLCDLEGSLPLNSSEQQQLSSAENISSTGMGNITFRDLFSEREMALWLGAYSDRVSNSSNNTPAPPAFENPLKVNGGFIAMAAGLSVVVPLICVLIIQLRRAKREEAERRLAEERARGGAGSGSDGGEGGTCDSPPSYEQLFGPDYVPGVTAPVHSRTNSLDMLIEEDEAGDARRSRGTGGVPSSLPSSSGSPSSTGGVSPITVTAGTGSSPGGGRSTGTAVVASSVTGLGGPQQNPTFSGSAVSVLSEADGANLKSSSLEVRGQSTDPSLSESEGYVSAPEDGAPVTSPRSRQDSGRDETASVDTNGNTASIDSGAGLQASSPPSPSLPSSSSSSSSSNQPSTETTSSTLSSSSSLPRPSSSTNTPSSSSTSSSFTTTSGRTAPITTATSTTTASSASDLPPPPDYTPPPSPPLPLTPPPPFNSEAGETSGEFRLHAVQRRYPNMHMSIQDFISTLRGQQEQERQRRRLQAQQDLRQQIETYGDTPPPTYEEALRILQKAKERENASSHNK